MASRTISGTLASHPHAAVYLEQRAVFVTDDATYLSAQYAVNTDAAGAFSIAVPVPDTGAVPYRIVLPDGTTTDLFIGSGAAIDLETLLAGD